MIDGSCTSMPWGQSDDKSINDMNAKNKVRVLVSGASGFVAKELIKTLASDPENFSIIAASRGKNNHCFNNIELITVQSLLDPLWEETLRGIDVVIHAASVTQAERNNPDSLKQLYSVNVDGTLNLARQAAKSNVKRFIFLSSIKVNGEVSGVHSPFTENDEPNPIGAYALSKYEAELGLLALSNRSGMDLVIIRPPLVYGVGVKGNFKNMLNWVNRSIPLPFGAIQNKRSLVAIQNLVDLIVTCINHPDAANQVFLVGDGDDLSTVDLLNKIASMLDKRGCLIPVPVMLLTFLASVLGKKSVAQRLCGSLQVDISKAQKLLGWMPPVSVDEGLRRAVNSFKK